MATLQRLAPPAAAPSRQVTQNFGENARIGTNIVGDLQGGLTIGSIDLSEGKREISVPGAAAASPPGARLTRPRMLDATLSSDGVHFSFGHALLIGVAAYQDSGLRVADGTTANDARELARLLRDQQRAAYPATQVTELIDTAATHAAVLTALDALAAQVAQQPNATALIFFAGHGERVGRRYALLPYDVQLKAQQNLLTATEFHAAIDRIRRHARRVVVILNCCHAGGLGDRVLGTESDLLSGSAPPEDFYKPLVRGGGQVVISSSRPSQKSGARSHVNPQHSTFGAHLLDALAGDAPGGGDAIGVFELFAHLRHNVPEDAKTLINTEGRALVQEPLFYAHQLDDNLAIALRPKGKAGATLDSSLAAQIRRLVELELLEGTQLDAFSEAARAERDALLAALG
ncbi:caspase family protein [Candidatus Gracilibacteria bacterium]|nr:caspase family protein [Candidatus Gracilibacteria bacterium]